MLVHEIVCSGDCEHSLLDEPDHATLDDRLKHLLRSNEAPLPTEENLLRGQIAAAEDVLVAYHRRVACLERELQRIRDRRDDWKELIVSRKAVLSPIRRLPSELIAEIIHHVIGPDDVKGARVTLDVRKGPWPLGQICRHWRDAVLSLPDLWSRPYISAYDIRSASPQVLDVILHRSRDQPLDLSVQPTCVRLDEDEDVDEDVYKALLGKLLKKLVSHSYRWRDAWFLALPVKFITGFDAVKNRLPLLEALDLSLYNDDSDTLVATTMDCFAIAPKLHSARVSHFPGKLRHLQLPWSQLKTLRILRCTSEDELDVLGQLNLSPRLEDIEFRMTLVDDTTSHDHEVIELPRVYRLSIDDWDVFACVRLPSLLCVTSISATFENIQLLQSLIVRSSCNLTMISLLEVQEAEDEVISLLRASPTISTLCIRDSSYIPSLLDHLVWAPGSQDNILPHLQRLSIELESDHFFEFEALSEFVVDIVDSRVARQTVGGITVSGLEALNFEIDLDDEVRNHASTTAWLARFDVFRALGINVYINLHSDLHSSESVILGRLSLGA